MLLEVSSSLLGQLQCSYWAGPAAIESCFLYYFKSWTLYHLWWTQVSRNI